MINLSYSYTIDDLKLAIYHFGLELWKEKKREIPEADYKTALSDTVFQWNKWDSNIINLFTQEGIIFRNPGTEPGHYTITPVYDALGGYLVASSLLAKHANDRIFQWLKEPEFITSFEDEDGHELAYDIFRSLVTLIPRCRFGTQLWKEIDEPFKNAALRFAAELEAEYIDEDTLTALLILMKDNPKERIRLFSQLQRTRGIANHPLNSEFLDKALRALSVSERDLSWTEWIRKNWSERFYDLLAIEYRWKNELTIRIASDQLQAKWVMWLLTSTNLELRDVATRALYWFGRGDVVALFERSLWSLDVNDPYISERMLAASYGVVMALHVDVEDNTFVKTTLPKFARSLYDSMLAKDAPFCTTHLLTREYAIRIIELAIKYNPNLFSRQEIERSKPPFTDGGIRDWGESKILGKERYSRDSPLHMDFENYTLGGLVKDRRNYDYEYAEYQKVRSRVLWRIEQLGWTSELFKDVDNSIANANERYWSRTGREAKKTERYGKKYSWIAYFELLGYLYDSGKIDLTDFGERDYDMDIDPSFPNDPLDYLSVTDDLLGDSTMSTQDWIENGDVPDIAKYLVMRNVANQDGDWVLLDGYINQEDSDRNRNRFTFIRTLLVKNQDAPEIIQRLENQDMGNRWLPEIPEMCGFLYAGEVPWRNTFPENEWQELEFVIGKEIKQVSEEELVFLKDNSPISDDDEVEFLKEIAEILAKKDEDAFRSALDKHGLTPVLQTVFREEEVEEKEKYEILIPVHRFSRSYEQTFESGGSCTILAKQLSNQLDLIGQPQTFDLFSHDGQRATISLQSRDENEEVEKNAQHFLYIRKELLDQFLTNEDLELVWIIWGERQYSISTMANLAPAYKSGEKKPWEVFQSVITYER